MNKALITSATALTFVAACAEAASQAEWDACIDETVAELSAKGMCGTSNCFDEKNRSLMAICREKVGSPPRPAGEAKELVERLDRGESLLGADLRNAQSYPPDSPVGRALARYWKRFEREMAAERERNKLIDEWRFTQDGGYLTIEGTTSRDSGLFTAAVECDGKYVGNALGAVQGGTFVALVNDVATHCREVSLSRISIK
jgi:hypothetical protein